MSTLWKIDVTWVHCVLQITMSEMDSEDDIIEAIYNAIDAAKDKPRVSYDPTEAPGMTMVSVDIVNSEAKGFNQQSYRYTV